MNRNITLSENMTLQEFYKMNNLYRKWKSRNLFCAKTNLTERKIRLSSASNNVQWHNISWYKNIFFNNITFFK